MKNCIIGTLTFLLIFVCSGNLFADPLDPPTPEPDRFNLVMNDEAVLDTETGLIWSASNIEYDSSEEMDWYDAQTACYKTVINGHMGWRLPTVEELTTIIDISESDPALPSGHPFSDAASSYYWSSTPDARYIDFAWRVSFSDGDVYSGNKPNTYYVRAVKKSDSD